MEQRRPHPSLNTPDGTQAFHTSMMRLVVQGYTRRQISVQLNIPVSTVDKHLDLLMEELRQQALEDVKTHYGRELQHLFLIRQEAWEAWTESKKKRKRSKVLVKRSGKDEAAIFVPMSQEHTESDTEGDPRYLTVALQTTVQIVKLVGIEKAVSLLNQVNVINISEASNEFNDRFNRFLAQYDDAEESQGEVIDAEGASLPRDHRLPESVDSEQDHPDRETS
jgi:hypothetical protein